MRAALVSSLDGPGSVRVADVPAPHAGENSVVIDVEAAGITYPDVLLTRGTYQLTPPLPFVPGSQVSGTVVSAPAASGLVAGARVCAFTLLGGFAEQVAVDPAQVLPMPEALSWEAGAAALTNYLTAHFCLLTRGGLVAGDSVLVHGAAGGVGLATVQLATALGADVIAVVSSAAKADAARRAGAGTVVDVDGFKDAAREATGGRGVDVVVDPVGGDRFTDSLRALARGGRLVVVGFVGGAIPTVKVNRLLLNNTSVVGAAWGEWALSRPGFVQEQWAVLSPLFASGALRPEVETTLPLERAAEGLRRLEHREVVGNVVLVTGR